MDHFAVTLRSDKGPSDVRDVALQTLAKPLARQGYSITDQGPDGITLVRRYRQWRIWVGVVALFPLGLLFLLISPRTATISMSFEANEGTGSRIVIVGEAPKRVRQEFAEMADGP